MLPSINKLHISMKRFLGTIQIGCFYQENVERTKAGMNGTRSQLISSEKEKV